MSNRDPYAYWASKMLDVPEEKVSKEQRTAFKRAFYGALYDRLLLEPEYIEELSAIIELISSGYAAGNTRDQIEEQLDVLLKNER